MSREDRVRALFRSIDAKDLDSFLKVLTDDAVLRFGNAPEVHGKDGIGEAIGGFFGAIKSLKHDLTEIHITDDTVAVEGFVSYVRMDNSELSVPFCDVFGMKGDLISRYFIYIDISALFA